MSPVPRLRQQKLQTAEPGEAEQQAEALAALQWGWRDPDQLDDSQGNRAYSYPTMHSLHPRFFANRMRRELRELN